MKSMLLSFKDEDYLEIMKLAKAASTTPGRWIKAVILEKIANNTLGSNDNKEIDFSKLIADEENNKRVKTGITLPVFLQRELKRSAKLRKMKVGPYIAAMVQSQLTREPVFSHNELRALESSLRELNALGRNLNQVARALNDRYTETDRLKLNQLKAIAIVLNDMTEQLRRLKRRSLMEWGAYE